ncbi:MAG TPA: ParA family protein [Chloroflexota bacterium]|nr:ParA family protein [Chloroflexota bacterium]
MSVIAVANQKGGVGKTTTVANLGAALSEQGYRVLLVDNDPQANLAITLGVTDPEILSPTLGDLLVERGHNLTRGHVADAIVRTPSRLDLLPANSRLSAAELALIGTIGREMIMRDLLAPEIAEYDFVVIDCLPSLGLLAINALAAADGVVIPVQADFLALQGLAQMLETVNAVRAKLNAGLTVLGAVLTMMDVRTAHARGVATMLREALIGQVRVFDAEIRAQVALKDCVQEGRSVLEYRAESQAAMAYRRLASEVIEALEPRPNPAMWAEPGSRTAEALEPAVALGIASALEQAPTAPPAEAEAMAPLSRFGAFLAGRDAWLGQQAR